jgi:hypothetical protein
VASGKYRLPADKTLRFGNGSFPTQFTQMNVGKGRAHHAVYRTVEGCPAVPHRTGEAVHCLEEDRCGDPERAPASVLFEPEAVVSSRRASMTGQSSARVTPTVVK